MRRSRPFSKTLTVKVSEETWAKVARLASERRTSMSAIVREAITTYDASTTGSFGDLTERFRGSVRGGPGDLATNPVHMRGFGAWKPWR